MVYGLKTIVLISTWWSVHESDERLFRNHKGISTFFAPLTDANDWVMLVEEMAMRYNIAICLTRRCGFAGVKYIGEAIWEGRLEEVFADTPGMAVCLAIAKAIQAMKESE